jgi:hypothetical protein
VSDHAGLRERASKNATKASLALPTFIVAARGEERHEYVPDPRVVAGFGRTFQSRLRAREEIGICGFGNRYERGLDVAHDGWICRFTSTFQRVCISFMEMGFRPFARTARNKVGPLTTILMVVVYPRRHGGS